MTGSTEATLNADLWKSYAGKVESYMAAYLDERQMADTLRQAMKYSLLAPGKRTRPILTMASCAALGAEATEAIAPASALEMIHCFSLIHDDLPAMDDDDLRRGVPTLHKHAGEDLAILAGDALSAYAFELIAFRVENPALVTILIQELTSATNDMISGQVYDTLKDFDGLTEAMDQLKLIHRNKTGALIRCASRMGAACAGADEQQMQSLTVYGEAIGLMFQVVDDILDVTASTEQLGKTAGKDQEQDKLTYPALIGLDESRSVVEELRVTALDALSGLGENASTLRELCEYLAVRMK